MVKRNSHHQAKLRDRVRRTNPVCHICGGPISWDAPHLDPQSFVIDHVVSLARGGADDITNVRASHRSCNGAKGTKDIAPDIVRRSGSLK